MFGIDFSELVVCLIVALFVIGPQRLPETVRTLGLWVGRFKRSLRETRETIEQQLGVEEIRRQLHTEEMMRTLDNMQEEIETALNYERRGNKPALEHSAQEHSLQEHSAQLPEEPPLSLEAQVFVDAQLSLDESLSSRVIEYPDLANSGNIKTANTAQAAANHHEIHSPASTSELQPSGDPSIARRSLS